MFLIFGLFLPFVFNQGDVIVDVTDEVATDLSQFISSTDAVASSGMEITTYHY